MKTKSIFRCLAAVVVAGFLSLTANSQNVNVTGALVGNGTYVTLGAAFTAINSGAQTGAAILVTVVNNTTEGAAAATLNAGAWTTLSIQPSGGAWAITGATTAGNPMVDFNGADNVTVDGLNSGGNALTISNTTVSATGGTSTMRFQTDATNNTITRCSVLGSATMPAATNGGNIWFASGAVTTGNDNNTISFCTIGPAGTNLPTKGIYFTGTSTALSNSGINIANNTIFDFFSATTTSAGIYISASSTDVTIQNNKFYQSATRTQTTAGQHSSIWITNTAGINYTVSGNTIGYNTSTATGTYTFAGVSGSSFIPIYLNIGSTTASSVQGNTITNIAISGAMNGTNTSAPFRGIHIQEGLVNIGNLVGNTIGNLFTNGAITYTSTSTLSSEVIGIYNFSSFNTNISNNNVGGITAGNSSTGAAIIHGIRVNTVAAGISTVQNNNIGGATIGSIQCTSISTASQIFGIFIIQSNAIVTGNNIASLSILNGAGTTTSPSVGGIVITATSCNHTVTGNRIAAFGSIGPASTGNVTGIVMSSTTGTNVVGENLIHSLVSGSAVATINGIYVNTSTCTYRNNMIRLGIDPAGAALTAGMPINGINETNSGTNNFYFNTVYIGGSGVGGSSNTFAFQSSIVTNVRNYQNNIFWNARSNGAGTGKHYGIRVGGTAANPAGLTCNYNDILVTGTGGVTGLFNAIDRANIAAWRAATGQDANSIAADPILINPTGDGTLVDLHIGAAATPIEQGGTPIAAVTIDYDGQTRSGLTPTDIGADAGNFIQLDIFAPVITYTALTGTCSTADRAIIATITDFSGVPTAGVLQPRIYYRKNAGPYFSSQGVLTTGSATNGTWTFTIINSDMGGVTFPDQVSYYVIAQDIAATPNITSNPATGLVASDVNTVTTHPTTPNVYSIAGTLNGTYTVGATGFFTTITSAVAAYNNACNITGPVIFSLIDATYPSEVFPITINPNAFASAVNTLTIKPATSVSPTITGSSAVAIFRLFGADFITIDGSNIVSGTTRDLTIRNTNTGFNSTGIWLSCFDATNGANTNTIKNCVVQGNATTTTLGCIVSSGTVVGSVAEIANNNNTYQNNTISTAFYGIAIVGPTANESGTVITGNNIGSAVAANKIGYQAIFVAQEANVTINDNIIAGIDCPFDMGATVASAICVGGTATGGTILRNRISDIKNTTSGGFGVAGILLGSTVTVSNMTVANNFVSDIAGLGYASGIAIDDNGYGIAVTGNGYNIYHNSVTLNTNQVNAGARSATLWISNLSTAGSLDIRNNLFINAQTTGSAGQRYAIYCEGTSNAIFSNINYNDYFTLATNLGFITSNRANLAAVQTGFGGNANSVNILPVFTTTTDLHLPVASNPNLQDLAAYLPAVAADIDLQTRNTCGTEMGADEIGTPREINVAGNSVAITDGATATSTTDFTDFGTQSVCNGTLTRTFTINNTGTAALAISGVSITGANAADFTVTTAPAASIAGSGSTSFVITFNPSAAGARNAIINVNNNDCDEAIFDFAVLGTGTQITAAAASQTNVTCNAGNDGSATVSTTGGVAPVTFSWAPSGGTAATASGLTAGTYTCTVTDANGCAATQIFTITQPAAVAVNAIAASPTICDGSSTTLTASGASTYSWMPGSLSGTTVTVNPSTTTTYTVTGTDVTGCIGTGMVTVTVNPVPTVTAAASPTTVCMGGSTTLTGSGATTYTWMPGSLSGASVTDIPSSTTTYTVTGTDALGCSSTDVVTVTVNPLPTVSATAGTPTICNGGSSTLTGNGATTYTWMPGSLSGTTVTVSPTTTTTYTVTGTDASGCSSTDVVTVTVNPLPTVTAAASPTTVCMGGSTTLTGTGATTYTWMPGSLSGASVTDIPSSTTTYTVTGTDALGCSNTDVVTVTVNPLPTVSATAGTPTICNGGSSTLTGNGATTYTWMPGSLSGTTVTVSPTATTTYTVTGTDASGCSSTDVVTVTVNPLPTVTATAGTPTICNGGSSTLTGNGATTYAWMPGALSGTTVTVSPTATTTYTVTGTDGNGCSSTDVVTVTVNPTPTVTATAGTPTICNGGSSTLTGNGATTYTWMPGSLSGTTVTVSPTATTTYTVTGTNASGCSSTDVVTVTVNPLPTVSATAGTPTICSGNSSTLTGTGATTYAWMPGALSGTTVTVSPTTTTTYTVTGTDAAGCSSTDVVTVTVNPTPTVTATAGTPTICSGNSSTLTGNGASTYTWMPGSLSGTTVTVSPTTTTTYTVTGTSGAGCSSTGLVTVTVNPTPTVTATAGIPTICSGNSSTLTGNGATTYTWMPGSLSGTTVTVSPTTTTTYTVTGTTGAGCSSTGLVTVTVNPTPTVTATAGTPTICSGSSSTLTGNGATTYTWMPGSLSGTTVTVSPTTTTTYTVTGTSGAGCSSTGLVTVTVNPSPVVNLGTDITQCSGTALLDAQNAGATYLWSDNSTSQTLTAAATGIYWVDVTNASGCTSRDSISVTINSSPVVAFGPDITQCGGTVLLDAGNPGSTYLWNDNSTNQTLTVTTSGTYSVVATLPGGCTATDAIIVTINTLPTVSATAGTPTICSGNSSTLTGNGATTYTWMPGSLSGTTVTVSPTTTTTYTVTGTDGNGCSSIGNVTVTVNPTPTVTATAGTPTICSGGSSTLTGNGATTYTWMPGSLSGTTVTVSPTTTTTYTVTGTSTGCSSTGLVTVTVNPTPTVTAIAGTPTICSGSSSTLTGNGATTYTWMPGSLSGTTVTVSPTTTTTYTVTGTSTGCSSTGLVTVTVNPTPTVTATAGTPTICSGSSSTLTGNGATTYTWMPGSLSGTTVTVSPTTTTTYTVTGTSTGCSSTGLVTVTVNPTPTVTATAGTPTICSGSSSTLTGNGATTYTWMPGSLSGTTVTVSPTTTTTYTVTGTSGAGCSSTGLVTVTVNPTPTVTATAGTPTICSGGSSTLTGNGATTYTWMPGSLSGTTVTVSPTTTTTYTVTGTSGAGCSSTGLVTVTVNPTPTVTATAGTPTICSGGSSTLTGNGATTYTWMPGSLSGITVTVSPTTTTTYTVTGTSGAGCSSTGLVTVTVNPTPTVTATAGTPTICSGNSSTLTGNGATTYTWMPGSLSGTTVTVSPTTTTTYTVTGTSTGCSSTGLVTVTVNPTPTVTATAGTPTICSGNSSTLTGNGATTYTWMPGSLSGTTVTVSPTTTTTYTVTGTSGAGCSSTGLVTVTVNPTPTVTATAGTPTICSGNSSTLTGNGATTYTWMPGSLSGTTVTVSPTTTTTYTVTGTTGAGCSSTGLVTVTVNPTPTVTATAGTPTICSGSSSTLTGNGATTYTWMPGSLSGTTVTVSPTTTTTYTVTGTSGAGCSSTGLVTVTVNPTPTVTATAGTPTICSGSSSTLTGNGATTYTWMPGSLSGTTVTVSPTTTTTYTVTGTSTGCSSTGLVTVTVNPTPTVTATAGTPTICSGSSSTLTGNGATTYTWMPGSLSGTTVTVSPTTTTTYTVTGTSGAGCSSTGLVTVTVNPTPTVTATAGTPTICSGGSSTLTGNGATTYTWMPGSLSGTTVTVSPATTTTYTVTGTSTGCSSTGLVTVTVNPTPTVTATAGTPTICSGNSSTLTGNGATTYTWMPGALSGTTVTVSPATTTTYTVTGTSTGCSSTGLVTVTVNPTPTVTATAGTPTICSGNSSTLTGNGATTYTWMPGALSGTTVTVSPTTTTTYTVTGTSTGCSSTGLVTVTVNPTPTVTATAGTPIICNGGSSTLTGNGATTYTWMPGSLSGTTVTVSPIATTTYTVTGTSTGCSSTGLVTVTVNPLPTVTASSTASAVCSGNSVTLTGGGATSYSWSGGVLNAVPFVPVATLTYTVTGTDGNGCTNTASTTVTVNPLPVVALGPDVTQCAGTTLLDAQNAGSTYMWNDNTTAQTLTASVTGIYWVDVTSTSGCTSRDSISVTINANPVVALGTDITQCGGTALLDAGNAGATFLWSDNSTNQTLTASASGTYSVLVTLATGCTSSDTIVVTINNLPVVALGVDTTQCGGTVLLDAGNVGATYLWSDNTTAQTLTASSTGVYHVTVTDVSGCASSDTINITINAVPAVALGNDTTMCGGSVLLDAQNAGATYLWSDNSVAQTLPVNATGIYAVAVTNASGCTTNDTISITINALPSVNIGPDSATCAATVLLDAGNPGDTYLWSDNTTSQTIAAITTGIFWVDVTNASGCTSRDSVSITINTNPVVTLGNDTAFCGGSILLDAANTGATYLWNDNSTNQTLLATASGTYYVLTTLTGGCTATDTIVVTINAVPVVNLGSDISQCGGITLLDAGATTDAAYLWSDNTTAQSLAVSTSGFYYVTVTDSVTGCASSDSINVAINAAPSITFTLADTLCDNGGAIVMNATPAGGTYFGVGVSGTSFDPSFPGPGTTTITYTYTDTNGCSATTNQSVFVDDCSGIAEQVNNASIIVYPNPNNGQFTIQVSQMNGQGVLEITDALGQLISSETVVPANGSLTKEVNLSMYANGIYFVRFTTNATSTVQKVNVQR